MQFNKQVSWMVLLFVLMVAPGAAIAQQTGDARPWDTLPVPQLGVRIQDNAPVRRSELFVWVRMPQIEQADNVFELLCYEDPRTLVFLGQRELDGGVLELRHRVSAESHVLVVTELTPQPGKVQIVTRLESDGGKEIAEVDLPNLNMCPSLIRARGSFVQFDSFASPYPEIIERCFIFADEGRTFLSDTVRRNLPRVGGDDPRNNPPWIQVYDPVWEPVHPASTGNTWYNHSPTRYTVPILGVVSLDGEHMIAIADDTSDSLCQAWAPCLHHYTEWTPHDAPPAQRVQRINVYVMPNDPDMLLQRVAEDLPDAMKMQNNRVPAGD